MRVAFAADTYANTSICSQRRFDSSRTAMEWPKTDSCAGRVVVGFGLGAGLGSSIGACYGTFEAFRYKIPGLFKIRYIGQTTVSSGLAFGVFLAAGALLHCDRVQ